MSATKQFCKKQLQRCSGLDLYNTLDEDGSRELLRALMEASADDAHAKVVIDKWLKTSPKRPTPYDIYRTADETRPPEVVPPGCDVCQGEPWIRVEGGMARCTCAAGQWFRQKDRENGVAAKTQREAVA